MADLVHKAQFEKICPFPVLNEVMQALAKNKEAWGDYEPEEILSVLEGKIKGVRALQTESLITYNLNQIASIAIVCIMILEERRIKPDS